MTADDKRVKGIAGIDVGFGQGSSAASVGPLGDSLDETSGGGGFRILVVGGFAPSAEFATEPHPYRPAVGVTPSTFDDVMTQFNVSAAVDVPDPSDPRGKPLRITLAFPRLRSFRPDAIVHDVAAFRLLTSGPPAVSTAPSAAPKTGSLIDELLGGMVASTASSAVRERRDNGEQKAVLLRTILGHPEVRRLERAWRGLRFLVERVAKGGVSIDVLHAEKDDVADALANTLTGRSDVTYDLIVVDYEVGAQARDLDQALAWSGVAESIPAPLLTNASPNLLGFEDVRGLARTERRVRNQEGPRAVLFRTLTEKEPTRWLLLAANGIILREGYTSETARVRDVPFEEETCLSGGAAWAVAVAAANAFAGSGWASTIAEPKYAVVSDLNVHMTDDRGAAVSIAAEAPATPEAAAEVAAAGITLVTTMVDRDVVAIPSARMAYRGPVRSAGVLPAAEVTLADQLFVGRMAALVTDVASLMPRDIDAGAARDTARIAVRSMFRNGDGPLVDASLIHEHGVLQVTIKPRGFVGVRAEEVTLHARIGA